MGRQGRFIDGLLDRWEKVHLQIFRLTDRFSEWTSDRLGELFEHAGRLFGRAVIRGTGALVKQGGYRSFLPVRVCAMVLGAVIMVGLWLICEIGILAAGLVLTLSGMRKGREYKWSENAIIWVAPVLFGLALPIFGFSDYQLAQLSLLLIYAIIVLGLNIVTGVTGLPSLGHSAFALVGAYATALLFKGDLLGFSAGSYLSVMAGGVAAAIVGILIGLPAVRVKGPYLALVTLALMLSVPALLKSKYLVNFTGGDIGLSYTKPLPPELLHKLVSPTAWIYYIVLGWFAGLFFSAHVILRRTRVGRALVAIRDGEEKSNVAGIDVPRYKMVAFALSAFYAGVGGGLITLSLGYVSSESFTMKDSFDFLVAMAIGGRGSLLGSVLGGAFLTYHGNVTTLLSRYIANGDQLFWACDGAVVILVVLFAPRGLAGEIVYRFNHRYFKLPRRRHHRRNPFPDYDSDEELLAVQRGDVEHAVTSSS